MFGLFRRASDIKLIFVLINFQFDRNPCYFGSGDTRTSMNHVIIYSMRRHPSPCAPPLFISVSDQCHSVIVLWYIATGNLTWSAICLR